MHNEKSNHDIEAFESTPLGLVVPCIVNLSDRNITFSSERDRESARPDAFVAPQEALEVVNMAKVVFEAASSGGAEALTGRDGRLYFRVPGEGISRNCVYVELSGGFIPMGSDSVLCANFFVAEHLPSQTSEDNERGVWWHATVAISDRDDTVTVTGRYNKSCTWKIEE